MTNAITVKMQGNSNEPSRWNYFTVVKEEGGFSSQS